MAAAVHRGGSARDARPRRPHPRHRSVRSADERRYRRSADTRFKIVPSSLDDTSLVEAERTRGKELSERLSIRVLSRAWQMLSKGIAESASSGKPAQAAEMVLVRLAYAADLPTPDEALKMLGDGGGNTAASPSNGGGVPSGAPRMQMAQGGATRLAVPRRVLRLRLTIPRSCNRSKRSMRSRKRTVTCRSSTR
jgi:DNA polymerase III gamma/tau subunit